MTKTHFRKVGVCVLAGTLSGAVFLWQDQEEGLEKSPAWVPGALSLRTGRHFLPPAAVTEFDRKLAQDFSARYATSEEFETFAPENTKGDAPFMAERDPNCDCIARALFDVREGAPLTDAGLERAAREYVDENVDTFLHTANDLKLAHGPVVPQDGMRVLTFERTVGDVPLFGAYVQFVFLRHEGSYRLAEVVSRSYGNLTVEGPAAQPASLETLRAITGLPNVAIAASQEIVFPDRDEESGAYRLVRAHFYALQREGSGERYLVMVENGTGKLLQARSEKRGAIHRVLSETNEASYILNDLRRYPLKSVAIGNVRTDATGTADINGANFTVTFTGAANVFLAGSNQPYSVTVPTGQGGQTILNAANTQASALAAYTSVQRAKDYVGQFLTTAQVPFLGAALRVNVDVNENCNAFYDGVSINFFRQGMGCANTALVADVVMHEWGHGLDDFMGRRITMQGVTSGILDGAFSEGIGDLVSAFTIGNPAIGRGFFLNSMNPLRTTFNDIRHPPATQQEREVHNAGRIISGAFWDMRENFVAQYGPTEGHRKAAEIFFRHLLTTDVYIDAVAAALRLNDNDANPATPAPDQCKINRAFARHGLAMDSGCLDGTDVMKVAIKSEAAPGQVELTVSALGAKNVHVCKGSVPACGPTAGGALTLARLPPPPDAANASRVFYEGSAKVSVTTGERITLVATNVRDQPIARQVVEFGAESE